MQEVNKNLKIKGFVFKKFPTELKVIFIISVISYIVFLVFYFLDKEKLGNEIFSIEMMIFLVYFLFYCFTKKKELKIEDGNLYFNNEEIRLKGYKIEYGYGNKIYLQTEDGAFLFYAHSSIKPSRFERIYLREKVMELEKYLQNEKIPIKNDFNISGNKIYFSFLGIVFLLPLITAIIQTIGKIFLK